MQLNCKNKFEEKFGVTIRNDYLCLVVTICNYTRIFKVRFVTIHKIIKMSKCLECEKPMVITKFSKKKVFCSASCRIANWRKNKNKKKCLESELVNADLLIKIEDYITKRHPIVLLEKSGVVDFIPIADERYMKFLKMIIQLYDTPKETEVKVKDLNDTASKSNRTINTLNHEPKENSFHFFNKYGCFTNAERLELEKQSQTKK